MATLVHYNNLLHGPSVLGMLNEQRLSGQMCDTVLVVGDQRYQAHRSVLAASSEYFQSLFTRTEADAPKVVHLDICEADAFEEGSLAAIQELGYSLGIPFLSNIASTRPHVSYCVSRKRHSLSEEDETDSQTRSVIVMTPRSTQQEAPQPPTHHNPQPVNSKATGTIDDAERKPVFPYSSTLKGNSSLSTMIRPQLSSSVSFSDIAYQGQPGEHSQTIDRSGPFIESLLCRSLSMDSTVPVFSPTLELHGCDQYVVKSALTGTDTSVHNSISDTSPSPLVLRTKYPGGYDEHATQVDDGVCVKAEASSPLGDPLEVLRITIGDTLPVNLKRFQPNIEQGPRAGFDNFGKRKGRADNRRCPFKKSRGLMNIIPLKTSVTSATKPSGQTFAFGVTSSPTCLPERTPGPKKSIDDPDTLFYHAPTLSALTFKRQYMCKLCHRTFKTAFILWNHEQSHGHL
uniref:Uncharacterized protein n=1 Tax=Gadus morhua TaxID=8049 RepID=A0A8C5ALV9_GADMO